MKTNAKQIALLLALSAAGLTQAADRSAPTLLNEAQMDLVVAAGPGNGNGGGSAGLNNGGGSGNGGGGGSVSSPGPTPKATLTIITKEVTSSDSTVYYQGYSARVVAKPNAGSSSVTTTTYVENTYQKTYQCSGASTNSCYDDQGGIKATLTSTTLLNTYSWTAVTGTSGPGQSPSLRILTQLNRL
ncbi:MAG: hypothetical protein ACKN9M_08560 [Burkholderiaceae bacterium]